MTHYTSVAIAQAEPPIRFTFEASALGLFGRILLVGLSAIFLVPLPWTVCWYFRWIAAQVRATNGQTFQFLGTAATVWKLVAVYCLTMLTWNFAMSINLGNADLAWVLPLAFAVQLILFLLYWNFVRWAIKHLELDSRRWNFNGSAWGFFGWNLLIYVSLITVIGWAWASVGLYNWIADNVQDAGGKLRFLGAGHQMLWRTIVMALSCVPIVTIPWAIKWYYDWLINQVELTPAAEA